MSIMACQAAYEHSTVELEGVQFMASIPSSAIRQVEKATAAKESVFRYLHCIRDDARRFVIQSRQLSRGSTGSSSAESDGSTPHDNNPRSPRSAVNGTPCAAKAPKECCSPRTNDSNSGYDGK